MIRPRSSSDLRLPIFHGHDALETTDMAELRIRIELKRPRKGIEMAAAVRLAEEAQKFLRMVADDVEGSSRTRVLGSLKTFTIRGLGLTPQSISLPR